MNDPTAPGDNTRRRLLTRALKLLALFGLVVAAWPFVAAFLPDRAVDAQRRQRWERTIDLAALRAGEQLTVDDWPGGVVAVYRRSAHEIEGLARLDHLLYDAQSEHSRQPDDLRNTTRSYLPEYFIFIPAETSRGCHVRYLPPNKQPKADIVWYGGFVDLCRGSLYDTAGRVYRGTRQDQQHNLVVPEYSIDGSNRIRLRIRGAVR